MLFGPCPCKLEHLEEHLQFVLHLLAKEDDYAIDHATEAAIHELVSSRNIEELSDLFNNMDER